MNQVGLYYNPVVSWLLLQILVFSIPDLSKPINMNSLIAMQVLKLTVWHLVNSLEWLIVNHDACAKLPGIFLTVFNYGKLSWTHQLIYLFSLCGCNVRSIIFLQPVTSERLMHVMIMDKEIRSRC